MHRHRALAALLVLGLLLAACGGPPAGDAERIDAEVVADLAEEDARAAAQSVNAFGFALLDELGDGSENIAISPLSVATLLATVLAGAEGETAAEMQDVLRLDAPRDTRVGGLLGRLADTEDVTLSVANALWADRGTPLEDDYLEFVRSTFGATLEEADLGAQDTADDIDDWVDERTNGLIEDIAEDLGLPDPRAVLVLLNAVYFLGQWTEPFDPDATRDEPFTLPDGSAVEVPLMHRRDGTYPYAERDGYRMLRLSYGDDARFGMDVLLPDEGTGLDEVLATLDADEWQASVDALTDEEVEIVALPRFELEWEAELNEPLADLGMPTAFTPAAEFRPMSPTDPWLDVVVHKTHIIVDEEGTEAAAVTGGVMLESAPADPIEFVVDRPFAITISDRATGGVLFLATVADPRG